MSLVLTFMVAICVSLLATLAIAASPEVIDVSAVLPVTGPGEPVTVFVKMPSGGRLVRSSPEPTAQEGDWIRMDVELTGDTTFTVDFRVG